MPMYKFPCQDGSHPNCHGTVSSTIPFEHLNEDQIEEIIKLNGVCLERNQIPPYFLKEYENALYLLDDDEPLCISFSLQRTACPACESNQT